MFALIALICFILALFHVVLGELNLEILGFIFVSLHLMYAISLPVGRFTRRPQ